MKRHVVESEQDMAKMLSILSKHDRIGYDVEFRPDKWAHKPEFRSANFAVRDGKEYTGFYVPVTHQNRLLSKFRNYDGGEKGFWARLKPVLENPKIIKCCHSSQVESGYSKLHGVELGDAIDDSEIKLHLWDENPPYLGGGGITRLTLKESAPTILGREFTGATIKLRDLEDDKDIGSAPIEDAALYGTMDAIATLALCEWLDDELPKENLDGVYRQLEIPYVRPLRDLVLEGVPINILETQKQLTLIESRIAEIESEVRKETGNPDLNLASTQQLAHTLFTQLGYKLLDDQGNAIPPERTAPSKTFPQGQIKMNEAVKEALANAGYPVAKLVNEHTKLGKFKGTYHQKYLDECRNGLFYPKMRQCATVTWRLGSDFQQVHRPDKDRSLSCSQCGEPHQHLISVRTLVGVLPESGEFIIGADYSQLELRLLAHFTQDPFLLNVYNNMGGDLHQANCDAVHAAATEMKTKVQFTRQDSKPIGFGLVYGLDVAAFIKIFGDELGRKIHAALQKTFAGMESSKNAYIHQMHLDGFIRSLAGRKRRLHSINSEDFKERGYAERQGWNFLMQSSGADIVKMAQIKLHRTVPEFRQFLNIHDELIGKFRGTKKQAVELAKEVKYVMENIVQLTVPLIAEPGIGFTWLDAKK